jgi:hypothetical protein
VFAAPPPHAPVAKAPNSKAAPIRFLHTVRGIEIVIAVSVMHGWYRDVFVRRRFIIRGSRRNGAPGTTAHWFRGRTLESCLADRR